MRLALGLTIGALAASCGVERVTAVEEAPGGPDAGTSEASVVFDAATPPDAPAPGHDAGGDSADAEPPSEPPCAKADAVCISSASTCMVGMYFLYDNHFNCGGTTGNACGPESAYACWNPDGTVAVVVDSKQVAANATVLTYAALQRNFDNPPVGSFQGITATFEETGPPTGIYEDAFEVWLDQQAILVMVWVDNHGRMPDGTRVTQAMLGGRTYDVWSSTTGTPTKITLVSTATFTSGTVDLLQVLKFVISQNLVPAGVTLQQIEFGVEIASTGGLDATFQLNRLSIDTN